MKVLLNYLKFYILKYNLWQNSFKLIIKCWIKKIQKLYNCYYKRNKNYNQILTLKNNKNQFQNFKNKERKLMNVNIN